jgi:cytochrome c-type biogenesis protein CcmH
MEALAGMSEAEREAFMRERVAALAERLKREPEDAEGWRMLGRSYAVMGRHGDSRAAYAEALKRKPDDVELLAAFADSAVKAAAGGGAGSADAVAAYKRLLTVLPPGSPEHAQADARLKALTGGK